jgi:hypothetical protein
MDKYVFIFVYFYGHQMQENCAILMPQVPMYSNICEVEIF